MTNALLCVCRSKCNFIIVHHHLLKMAQNRAETFKNRNDYYHNIIQVKVIPGHQVKKVKKNQDLEL